MTTQHQTRHQLISHQRRLPRRAEHEHGILVRIAWSVGSQRRVEEQLIGAALLQERCRAQSAAAVAARQDQKRIFSDAARSVLVDIPR